MTNRQKRYLRSIGQDPAAVEAERIAALEAERQQRAPVPGPRRRLNPATAMLLAMAAGMPAGVSHDPT